MWYEEIRLLFFKQRLTACKFGESYCIFENQWLFEGKINPLSIGCLPGCRCFSLKALYSLSLLNTPWHNWRLSCKAYPGHSSFPSGSMIRRTVRRICSRTCSSLLCTFCWTPLLRNGSCWSCSGLSPPHGRCSLYISCGIHSSSWWLRYRDECHRWWSRHHWWHENPGSRHPCFFALPTLKERA